MQIYVDLSDLAGRLLISQRPGTRQRLQWNLVRRLSERLGSERVRCVFHHPKRGAMLAFDPAPLLAAEVFDADISRVWLDLANPSSRFPGSHRVRDHLVDYEDRKFLHGLKRGQIMLSALVRPSSLERMGLKPGNKLSIDPLPLAPIDALPGDAVLTTFGLGGEAPLHRDFIVRHARKGGPLAHWLDELGPVAHPEHYDADEAGRIHQWLGEAVTWIPQFVCVSTWIAEHLRGFAADRIAAPRIDVVRPAAEFDGFGRLHTVTSRDDAVIQAARRPFVLCVGNQSARKNGLALIDVWDRLQTVLAGNLPNLVFAGRLGSIASEVRKRVGSRPEIINRILVVNAPSDEDLAFLYQRSLFSVHPSLREGCGLPVAESIWFGRYCIASSDEGIGEGLAGLYQAVDAEDRDLLYSAIERAIIEPGMVKSMEQRIAAFKPRRWADFAADFAALVGSADFASSARSAADSGFELTRAGDDDAGFEATRSPGFD